MINKVTLIGNTGKDPEIKNFDNGGKIAAFTLATNEFYKNKEGERQQKVEWHNISVSIPSLVNSIELYVKKGMMLYIEGKLRTREYEKEGQKRYITEVQAETIKFFPKNNNEENKREFNNSSSEMTDNNNHIQTGTDDLPF